MKRVLITGADSYVGTAVRARLEKEPERFWVDELDVRDSFWRETSFQGIDAVFHVAGIAHVSTKSSMESQYMQVNRDLAIEVGRKAKREGVSQLIFMSSAIVYGDSALPKQAEPITYETEPSPADFYGKSKLMAEEGLRALECECFKVAILRCPMIYGPSCIRGNFPKLVSFARKLAVFPNYNNCRSMLYLGNLSELVAELVERQEGGLFLPQNPDYVRTADMVKYLAEAQGTKIALFSAFNHIVDFLLTVGNATAKKAFGSQFFDQSCSDFGFEYRSYSLQASIEEIARKDGWSR